MNRLPPANTAARLAVLAIGLAGGRAHACIEPTGSNDLAYVAEGAAQVGATVWFQSTENGITFNSTGAYLDQYDVLTAAHNIVSLKGKAVINSVSTSTNWNDPQSGISVGVTGYTVDPDYVLSSSAATTPDLAIIHLASPLPLQSQQLATAGPKDGDRLLFGGYGYSGKANQTPTLDGNSRGWYMTVDHNSFSIPTSPNGTYYLGADFESTTNSMSANAYGGDSGGRVLNSSGDLVGVLVAQYGGTSDAFAYSYFLNLTQPDIHAFILANTAVPEPAALALMVCGAAGGLLPRRSPARRVGR